MFGNQRILGSTNPPSYGISEFWNSLALRIRCILTLSLASVTALSFTGCQSSPSSSAHDAMKKLAASKTTTERFYALDDAAKESFVAGNIADARKYANELKALAPRYKTDWNYGNAIQDSNLVLGRIAVREGRIADAKQYLLEAGRSPGSPQMDTFGPNMSLAKDLLEKGETNVVLQYFESCRTFWKMDDGELNLWRDQVKKGQIPDFGANLLY